MLRIGVVGFGFMGRMHYRCWSARKDSQVVAICDVNPNIIEDSKKAAGNIAGAADQVDFSKLQVFTTLEAMLAGAKLDVVSITLPTFLHPESVATALKAGVHVLCEKPMALTAKLCDKMIVAAKKSGKSLMIGQCERFASVYNKAKELIESGQYGALRAASFRRVGAMPTWAWGNWFADDSRSGGVELDLHIHDADMVQYLFGMPKAVSSWGCSLGGQKLGHIQTRYFYDDERLITAEGGWLMSPTFGFEMGFVLMLEGATIVFDSARKPSLKVCPVKGEAYSPELDARDEYTIQIDHFARQLQGEKLPEVTTLQQARNSVLLVEKERKSAMTGKKVVIG